MNDAETRGLKGNAAVPNVHVQNTASIFGTARIENAGAKDTLEVQRNMNSHNIASDSGEDLILVKFAVTLEGMESVAHPYTFKTNGDVSDSVADMFASCLSSWYTRAMLFKPSDTTKPFSRTKYMYYIQVISCRVPRFIPIVPPSVPYVLVISVLFV